MMAKRKRQYSRWVCLRCGRYKNQMRVVYYGCNCRGEKILRSGCMAGSDVPKGFGDNRVRSRSWIRDFLGYDPFKTSAVKDG